MLQFRWWMLYPETILITGQLILSIIISVVLWRLRKHSATSRFLVFFSIANSMAILFHWLTDAAFVVTWQYQTDALTLFFYLLGGVALYYFAHSHGENQLKPAKFIKNHGIPLILLVIGGVSGAAYGILENHLFLMILLFMNIISYSIAVRLIYRKAADVHDVSFHSGNDITDTGKPEFSVMLRIKQLQYILFSSTNHVIRELRGYMLVFLLYFFLFLMSAAYWMFFYQMYPPMVHYFLLNMGFILFLFFFVHHFLSYTSKPVSFMTKLTMGTLTMVISVTAILGYVNLFLYDRDFNSEWIRLVESIALQAETDQTHLLTDPSLVHESISFILSAPLSRESSHGRIVSPYTFLGDTVTVDTLMVRDVTLEPEKMKRDEFVEAHFTRIWSYAGPDPEDAYILYTFETSENLYFVGFQGILMRDAMNTRGIPAVWLLLVSSLFVLVIFPRFFRRSLLNPLMNLVEGIRAVNEGNLDMRVVQSTQDEIGFLTRSFNQMVDSLNEANRYMKHYNQILRDKVKERTNELVKALETSKNLQNSLFAERELLKTTLHSMGDGLITTDAEGCIVMMNPLAERLTGWTQGEAMGKPFEEVFQMVDAYTGQPKENPVEKVMETGDVCMLEPHTLLIPKDGEGLPIEDSAAPILDKKGNVTGVVLVFRDYTEKKEKEEEILHLSYHDQLTGLRNRRFFEEELVRVNAKRNLPMTLVLIDLNGLKLINDGFGHQQGDLALQKVAGVLQQACQPGWTVARIGGDEFVMILPQVGEADAEILVNQIRNLISLERVGSLQLSASIGWATHMTALESVTDVFKLAEDRMYRRKLADSKSMHMQTIDLILKTFYRNHPMEKEHAQRVAALSEALAEKLMLEEETRKLVYQTGLMHDIGKIALDPSTLDKRETLTTDESSSMERHPELGYQILRSSQEYTAIADYVLSHHEHWDGSGYPRGLSGEEIPLGSRIIAITEAWDNMTMPRRDRKTFSLQEAVKEVNRQSGKVFDPELATVFLDHVVQRSGDPL